MADAQLKEDDSAQHSRAEPSRRKKHGSDAGSDARSNASTGSERRRRRVKSDTGERPRSSERGEAIHDSSKEAIEPPRSILRAVEQSSSAGRRVIAGGSPRCSFAPVPEVLEEPQPGSPDNSNYSASNYSAFGQEGVVGPARSDQGSDCSYVEYTDPYSLDRFLSPNGDAKPSQPPAQAAATKRSAAPTPAGLPPTRPESKPAHLSAPTPTSAMDRASGRANAVESDASFPRWFDGCVPAHALRKASTLARASAGNLPTRPPATLRYEKWFRPRDGSGASIISIKLSGQGCGFGCCGCCGCVCGCDCGGEDSSRVP